MRPIDADAAADKIMREIETNAKEIGIGAAAILIAFARALRDETYFPTIEAEPVRRGRWIQRRNGQYYCNNCGREERFIFQKNFCPKCGAKMGGGADN